MELWHAHGEQGRHSVCSRGAIFAASAHPCASSAHRILTLPDKLLLLAAFCRDEAQKVWKLKSTVDDMGADIVGIVHEGLPKEVRSPAFETAGHQAWVLFRSCGPLLHSTCCGSRYLAMSAQLCVSPL